MENFAILQLRFINLESDNHNFHLSVILPVLSEWCECSTKAQSIAGFLGPNCCSVHPKVHGGCTEAVVTMEFAVRVELASKLQKLSKVIPMKKCIDSTYIMYIYI